MELGVKSARRETSPEDVPQPKRFKSDVSSDYSRVSMRMMASMGYIPGKGIGKDGTGIAEPISESSNKGRLGLGYIIEGLEKEDVKWELEEVQTKQVPEWMTPCPDNLLTIEDFTEWIVTGKRKDTIEDETEFCEHEILKKILEGKTVFDNLSEKEFLDARTRSNPFESIKGVIFQNRAAMKMANIDAVFDFMFTDPNARQVGRIGPADLLFFADLCAGPGGFSEYVLWRRQWHAKGFGFTLKDPVGGSDFKLDNFLSASCETFDPHYGVGGYDGDGDITKPDNLEEFRSYVLSCTEGKGVHFVMADGGISVEGQENIQEILTKQLVLCQYLCALSILCKGGNFVCKVFDMFTPFSIGLFYLLYRCFNRVCLFKPVTSRPANSERYVVCECLLEQGGAVVEYLNAVNHNLIGLKDSSDDVLSIVPIHLLKEDVKFYNYVKAFNDSFGLNQITHLKKLKYFVKNGNLQDHRQTEIRRKCLELWKIPNSPRTSSPDYTAIQVFDSLWSKIRPSAKRDILNSKKFEEMDKSSLNFLKNAHSWRWCWAIGKRHLVVGLGRENVFFWDTSGLQPSFSLKSEIRGLELPKGSILEVEIVHELQGEGSGQRKETVIQILDVISISDKLYSSSSFKDRFLAGSKLCKAINKPCRKGATLLKMKTFYHLNELEKMFSKLELRDCKGYPGAKPTFSVNELKFYAPVGVIFFRITKDPWHIHLSRSEQKLYYYNYLTKESSYSCPPNSLSSFIDSVMSRKLWIWKRHMFKDLCSAEETGVEKKLQENEVCKADLLRLLRS